MDIEKQSEIGLEVICEDMDKEIQKIIYELTALQETFESAGGVMGEDDLLEMKIRARKLEGYFKALTLMASNPTAYLEDVRGLALADRD